eukprot:Sspe_Gene.41277::Locus_19962_Transcript_1_1_Confidence_1.000_Length_913::g.41277::m.41277/K00939/adk, AK; adenylate kinase
MGAELASSHIPHLFGLLWEAVQKEKPVDPITQLISVLQSVRRPKLIIKGPPASGKGTQCEQLVQHFGMVHISTGDILREQINKGTTLGKEAAAFMKAGRLVPDHLVISLVKNRLAQPDVSAKGWLLDGFPRTPAQARMLREEAIIPDCVVMLDVPDSEIIDRIKGRRIDPVTGKVYNIPRKPPPPEIAHRVIQRPDDTVEAIKSRLKDYYANLNGMLKEYSCPVEKVVGTGQLSRITHEVQSIVRKVQMQQLAKAVGVSGSTPPRAAAALAKL